MAPQSQGASQRLVNAEEHTCAMARAWLLARDAVSRSHDECHLSKRSHVVILSSCGALALRRLGVFRAAQRSSAV